MGSSSFGRLFSFTTFGESHGEALGCIVEGFPPSVPVDTEYIQSELDRRRPGGNALGTKRDEKDKVEILSGVYNGLSTGQPICMILKNENQRSKDYSALEHTFRPGHADYSVLVRYGIRDPRGGGRTSARETVARVMAGALAKSYLKKQGIEIEAGIVQIGDIKADYTDWDYPFKAPLYAPECKETDQMIAVIEKARMENDSVGALIECRVRNLEPGVGDIVFDKLDALLAKAMFSIGAVKGFEIGSGFSAVEKRGSENNDQMSTEGYFSNNAGGILGGISNGNEIVMRVAFKPTPSISKEQSTFTDEGENVKIRIEGRHDPCVGPRAVVVVEAMAAVTILDSLLIKRAYQEA